MWYELRDFAGFLAFVLALASVIGGLVVSIGVYQCHGLSRATGLETRWDGGCYVHSGDRWVPSNYVFGDAHEMRIKDGAL